MPSNLEIVKRLVAACEAKDMQAVRALVAENYTLKDPMMSLTGPDALIEMLESCPFDGSITHAEYLEAGDRVVMMADCTMTKPERFTWRMCDVLTVKNGKVVSEEMFYDSAQLPDAVKNAAPGTPKKSNVA